MSPLNAAELSTLSVIADRDQSSILPRSHLEKFSRLDLIEPCSEGVCMTVKGQKALSNRK
jgi:hypothetical protein